MLKIVCDDKPKSHTHERARAFAVNNVWLQYITNVSGFMRKRVCVCVWCSRKTFASRGKHEEPMRISSEEQLVSHYYKPDWLVYDDARASYRCSLICIGHSDRWRWRPATICNNISLTRRRTQVATESSLLPLLAASQQLVCAIY